MESTQKKTKEYDVIKKPRTNYSSNALRRAQPNVNIQQKKESITMNKIRVLSIFKLKEDDDIGRRVKTVDNFPHLLTIISDPPTSRKRAKTKGDQEQIIEEDELENYIMQGADDGGFSLDSESSIDGNEDEEMIF